MRKIGLSITIASFTLSFLSASLLMGSAQDFAPSFEKGICYVTWERERYSSPHSDKSLEMLTQTGAEWVEIIPTCYQDKFNSKKIFSTGKTPSDRSLVHVINQAHQLGMKVMLKPHIDLLDQSAGLCRGDIGFQNERDWQEWFLEYLEFILHYAKIAEETKTELFCMGTELCFASTKTTFWQKEIIPRIRKVYSGKLIYAANWDEYKNIRFWDDLDYVGIDAYFPISRKRSPGYEEIKASWIKWADEIESWQKTINKPVIFTEIGYRSCEFAARMPWEYSLNTAVNLEIQADCYKAALEVLCRQAWCQGIYWWYWKPSPYAGGLTNRDFTPQNKPAETILSYYYRGLSLVQIPQ